ncbi:MAG TPA: GTPase ObgE [Acidimicrobiales bacterium]|nr:GTPase ObgE [Acidimicrobiales bacterium]
MSGFVDEAQLHVKAGDGGAGSVSFRREAHVPKGGPDGGDGGKGGDVWLVADTSVASLLAFKDHPHRRAGNGGHGAGRQRHGANGADELVKVPVGTVVKDLDGNLRADLARAGDRWPAALGGRGGKGNARFLSNRRRAPSFAEQGEVGEERWYNLELKLMADVALVGFPNAGKSTLISRISAAKPKIADYPFTTLVPNLGVVRTGDSEFVVADIPGLIEGASEGRGLGHQFLRHVERARVLVVLLDLAQVEGRSPAEQERILLEELGRYEPQLLERPRLVIGTKADVAPPEVEFDGMRISAVTRQGLGPFLGAVTRLVEEARSSEGHVDSFVVHRPAEEGFSVRRDEDGAFRVVGRLAERVVAMADLTNPEALSYVQDRFRRLGVDRALARAGANHGDTVRIAEIELEYHEPATAAAEAAEAESEAETGPRRRRP